MDLTTTLDVESRELPQNPQPLRWGPWATLGWGVPLAASAILSQTLGAFGCVMWWRSLTPDQPITRDDIATNGPLLAFALVVSAPIVIGLLAIVVRASRVSLREYLALKWPRWRDFGIGAAALAGVLLATGAVAGWTGQATPGFMGDTYNSAKAAGPPALLFGSFLFPGAFQERFWFPRGLL